jgi:hypothetical protein
VHILLDSTKFLGCLLCSHIFFQDYEKPIKTVQISITTDDDDNNPQQTKDHSGKGLGAAKRIKGYKPANMLTNNEHLLIFHMQ